jgi:hypothetical protein
MKKILLLSLVAIFFTACEKNVVETNDNALALKSAKVSCTTIQDQVLTYSAGHFLAGQPIPLGFDMYGYNYQAHMFKGSYANAYLGGYGYPPYNGDDATYLAENPTVVNTWVWPYRNDHLLMKWNDAWLSNKDCDGDGKLDRHYGFDSYIGSGAWETNEESGTDANGKWTYFAKIVAAPADATIDNGVWYTANGKEIGAVLWNEFAVVQEVQSGKGATYVSPAGPGFGKY